MLVVPDRLYQAYAFDLDGTIYLGDHLLPGARRASPTAPPSSPPSRPAMLHAALAGLDVGPAGCVMVGDRLATDIRMALDSGMTAALVLTGETRPEDLEDLAPPDAPQLVLDRVDRILPPWLWKELGWAD
jgi:ribonucleotide monophosphatase NagD (HAD superfamily)